jgi:2-polyprenyl-6-methoxyphenol hydroxylase-like FAD-dependent oxidoreductase
LLERVYHAAVIPLSRIVTSRATVKGVVFLEKGISRDARMNFGDRAGRCAAQSPDRGLGGSANVSQLSKVLVVGAGIGGLTIAGALAAQGIEVDVIEKRDDNFALGIGIIQPANALRALRTLGLLEECLEAGFATDEWRYFEPDGTPLTKFTSIRMAGPELPAYNAIPRPALHRILTNHALTNGAKLHLGTTVTAIEERATSIRVTVSNGTTIDYDLMIGADGLRSQIRGLLFPDIAAPVFSGLSAWRFPVERPVDLTYQAMYFGVGTKAGLVTIGVSDI